ncbi:hypothetical protein N7451_008834 [Penicillium sp. IBT 35674x]|nr:hypothetical protein N7451_008834 [Penicillium sp. IBT 35674x]
MVIVCSVLLANGGGQITTLDELQLMKMKQLPVKYADCGAKILGTGCGPKCTSESDVSTGQTTLNGGSELSQRDLRAICGSPVR